MFLSILRVLLVYIIVLFVVRLMGKRQIGEMQPFELVITLIIADLATIPMAEHTLPLLQGVLPVLTLLIIHFSFSYLARKWIFARKLLSGKAVIIVSPDGVLYDNLKRLNMNINDLQEALRTGGYLNVSELNYAIVETNGTVSLIPKSANSPVVNIDLNIVKQDTELPIIVVSGGKILKENLKLLNLSKEDLQKHADKLGGRHVELKKVCIFTITESGEVFMQENHSKYIEGQIKISGGVSA